MASVRDWQPGDPAMLRLEAETEIRVTRTPYDDWIGAKGTHYDPGLPARPLAVLDPEGEDIERLADVLTDLSGRFFGELRKEVLRNALRVLANPTPPIEEPTGAGATVEDESGDWWVRLSRGADGAVWHRIGVPHKCANWGALPTVTRVLSEGVPAEAKS